MGILDFGTQIRAARENMGLTQTQAADLLGISRQALSMYENGKRFPPMATLPEYADKLGVKLTDRDKRDIVHAETTQTKLNAAMFDVIKTYSLDRLPDKYHLCAEGLNERTGHLDALTVERYLQRDTHLDENGVQVLDIESEVLKRIDSAEYDALVAECLDIVESLIDRHILAGIE